MDPWVWVLIWEICIGLGLLLLIPYSEWSMRREFRIPDDKIWIYPGDRIEDIVDLNLEFIELGDKINDSI